MESGICNSQSQIPMMSPPLTELHPIFLIIIKAISKFQKDGRTNPHIGEATDGYRHRKAPGTSPLLRCSGLIAAQAIAAVIPVKILPSTKEQL